MFVIFDRLTLMFALFPPGKTLCSWCLLHTHFQSWESSISPPNFMDFLGHRKSWNRRNFCRVSHLNKNIEKKKERRKVHPFFTSFLDNLKSLKVIFAWLTLMSALFSYGKILCPWCFSSHQLSLMEKLCTRFSCFGKTIHVCLSYSTPSVMRVFGMASQFYGFLRTQKIQKSEELMSSFTFKQKYWK